MSRDRAEFEVPKRQISIAPDLGLIDHDMGEAVHGFYTVFHLVDFGEIHVFPIVLEMSRFFPHIEFQNVGSIDELVASFQVFLSFKVFKEVSQDGPIGVVDDKAGADFIGNTKKIKFFSKSSVISLFYLFEEGQIFLQ